MTGLLPGLLAVLGIVAIFAVGLALKVFVDGHLHVAGGAGDRVMRGRAARHVQLLSRTLVVRGEADALSAVITPAMDPNRFLPVEPQDREASAWVTALPPAAGKTRVVVRPSTTPGWTEFGVVEYPWWSRFPQGARPYERVVNAAAAALAAAGLEVVERQRTFDQGLLGPTSDGPRRALQLDPAASVTLRKVEPHELRARRGEALAPQAGHPAVDAELLALLLDREDTLVTRRTADALLARGDVVGLRLVLLADTTADEDTSTWLWSAVQQRRAADGRLRETLQHLAASDADPAVRDVARQLVGYVFGGAP